MSQTTNPFFLANLDAMNRYADFTGTTTRALLVIFSWRKSCNIYRNGNCWSRGWQCALNFLSDTKYHRWSPPTT